MAAMPWHKSRNGRTGRRLGFAAVMMLVSVAAYGPIAPRGQGRQVAPGNSRSQVSGSFEELPMAGQRNGDAVVLSNGDALTGEVLGIEGETVRFQADMVEHPISVPFASLNRVELERRAARGRPGGDEVALVDGGRFRASVVRMDRRNLLFRPDTSDESPPLVVDREQVAAIGLGCGPLMVVDADFEERTDQPFATGAGQWLVHEGAMLHIDQNQHNARAGAPVRQYGRMRYTWSLDTTKGMSAGVYILASDRQASKGDAYRIMLEYHRVAVYKATEHGESQCLSQEIGAPGTKVRFKLQCDCGTGVMQIWVDDQQVASVRDKSPIRSGEYVILRADGRAAFEGLHVERLGGTVAPPDAKEGEDVVLLRNGDCIVGKVKEVSEKEVVVIQEGEEMELRLDRAMVWQTTFDGRLGVAPNGAGVVFWDGTRLEGAVRSLEGHSLVLENSTLGTVPYDVGRVRTLIFEE